MPQNIHAAGPLLKEESHGLLDAGYGKPVEAAALNINKQAYSYSDMNRDIDSLVKAYPNRVWKQVIGKSVLGREIPVVILGNPKASKKIIVIGSTHGREYMSTQLIMKQIDYYLRNPRETYNASIENFSVVEKFSYLSAFQRGGRYAHHLKTEMVTVTLRGGGHLPPRYNKASIENHLSKVCIHFVPMLNPDGVMLSQAGLNSVKDKKVRRRLLKLNKGSYDFSKWKANIRGVDLNRNFNAGWRNIPYMPPGPESYKGARPCSEPESRAIVNYISRKKFNALLTYHSSGQVVFWYFFQKGSCYTRDAKIAAAIAKTTGYKLPPKGSKVSCGGLKDWFIQDYKGPGFTIELGKGSSPLPFSQFNKIWKQNKYIPLLISRYI